jgi:hypothetical protein
VARVERTKTNVVYRSNHQLKKQRFLPLPCRFLRNIGHSLLTPKEQETPLIVLFSQIQRKYRVVRKYREKGHGGDLGLG